MASCFLALSAISTVTSGGSCPNTSGEKSRRVFCAVSLLVLSFLFFWLKATVTGNLVEELLFFGPFATEITKLLFFLRYFRHLSLSLFKFSHPQFGVGNYYLFDYPP